MYRAVRWVVVVAVVAFVLLALFGCASVEGPCTVTGSADAGVGVRTSSYACEAGGRLLVVMPTPLAREPAELVERRPRMPSFVD